MALPRLISPRLRLRAPAPADAEALSALSSHLEVARMLTRVRFPNPPHAVAAWIEGVLAGVEDAWVIEDAAGAPLGVAGLASGRLGYGLAPRAWGRGVATEAARAVLVHGFGAGRLAEIRASAFDDNPASRRVLGKLGFEALSRSRAICVSRRAEVDQTEFALSRAGWVAAQAPASPPPRALRSPASASGRPASVPPCASY